MKLYKDASMCAHFYGNIETSIASFFINPYFLQDIPLRYEPCVFNFLMRFLRGGRAIIESIFIEYIY